MSAQHLLQKLSLLLSCLMAVLHLMMWRLGLQRLWQLAPPAMLLAPSRPTQTPCQRYLGRSRPLLPQNLSMLLTASHLTHLWSRKAATLQPRRCTSCSKAGWCATSWMPSAAISCRLC